MAQHLKAILVELTAGNVRNHHIYLGEALGFFPGDCFGGSNAATAGVPIELHIAGETISTDIDQSKSIFRTRRPIRQLFEQENVIEGDLILIERLAARRYRVSKADKRGFKYYL